MTLNVKTVSAMSVSFVLHSSDHKIVTYAEKIFQLLLRFRPP